MILNLSGGMTWTAPDYFLKNTNDFLNENILEIPSELPTLKISEHAEKHRVMPAGTPRPGPLDLKNYTPHLIEPMDTMSPDSMIQRTVILKGAQQGYTMMAECVLLYYMGYSPADILFMSATADSLERWSSRRLESAIDTYDYRKYIYAQETNTKTRKSGDKVYSKQYFGCRLDMASYGSPAAMASVDKRILIQDETDRAKVLLSTGEGSPMEVARARLNAWGDRSKNLVFSTPTTYDTSYVWKEYLKGDQRKYFMPCPRCGEYIQFEMEFDYDRKGFGFKPIYDDNEVVDCVYICQECKKEIKEYEKQLMLQNGEWRPTTKSTDKFLRSYYSPSVLAPSDMLSWTKIYKKYLEAKEDPDIGMRTFTNIYMGLPFQETGERPKIENVHHLRGIYKRNTIPDDVLFLTLSADVQRGKEKYQDMNADDLELEIKKAKKEKTFPKFPRVEIEILGHGMGYRTWSINHLIFNGHIGNIEQGAWKKISDYFKKLAEDSDIVRGGYKIPSLKRHDGYNFEIPIGLFDAGDGMYMDIICSFTDKYANFYPSMGVRSDRDKREKGDRQSASDKSRYRLSKSGSSTNTYMLSTLYYKRAIYQRGKIERSEVGQNRAGFMDHPQEYTDEYFRQLFNEEVRRDGTFHAGNRPVEALDLKVYNFAAGDIYLDMLVNYWQDNYKKKGYSQEKVKNEITKIWVLQYLKNLTKIKK